MTATAQSNCLRFGVFELDLAAGELRRGGRKVRLQEQPFQLLAALVEKQGEVVTRDELKDKLWPGDTYVDFDRSLNTAASKLRDALGDSAANPRFIETLPRRGYRFLAPVEPVDDTGAFDGPPETATVQERPSASRDARFLWSFSALATLGFLVVSAIHFLERPAGPQLDSQGRLMKLTLSLPDDLSELSISPDGRRLAFIRHDGNEATLWIQDLDREEPRRIAGPGRLMQAIWSPDSETVAFFSGRDRELKKVSAEGGPTSTICEISEEGAPWGAWSPDGGTIVFPFARREEQGGGLYSVPAQGGKPELLFEMAGERQSLADVYFLPSLQGERRILFAAGRGGPYGMQNEGQIFVKDLDSGLLNPLVRGRRPVYSPSGHILYESTDAPYGLWAVPFSLETHEVAGEPFLVRDHARYPTISANGRLIYRVEDDDWSARLVWRDRKGATLGTIGQPQTTMLYPSLSPDESRVAVRSNDGGDAIWIHDVARPVKRRLAAGRGSAALWSSDGRDLVFSNTAQDDSPTNVYRQSADGGSDPELIFDSKEVDWVSDWSNDGRTILFDHDSVDVWRLEDKDDGSGFKAAPLLTAGFIEKAAKLSPDGSHIAFVSSETGDYEVYVSRFPEGDSTIRVSTSGGTQPRWSADGAELFYVERGRLMAAKVRLGDALAVTSVKELFQDRGLLGSQHPHYDVSKDGQRFVVREYFRENEQESTGRTVLVENWDQEFREDHRN